MENKEFETHTILLINDRINDDPVLMHAIKLLFDWANEAGLNGIKVNNLEFIEFNSGYLANCNQYKGKRESDER